MNDGHASVTNPHPSVHGTVRGYLLGAILVLYKWGTQLEAAPRPLLRHARSRKRRRSPLGHAEAAPPAEQATELHAGHVRRRPLVCGEKEVSRRGRLKKNEKKRGLKRPPPLEGAYIDSLRGGYSSSSHWRQDVHTRNAEYRSSSCVYTRASARSGWPANAERSCRLSLPCGEFAWAESTEERKTARASVTQLYDCPSDMSCRARPVRLSERTLPAAPLTCGALRVDMSSWTACA